MFRKFGYLREKTPAGAVRAANFVESNIEPHDAEVVSITHDGEKFTIFYSAKSHESTSIMFQDYIALSSRKDVRDVG